MQQSIKHERELRIIAELDVARGRQSVSEANGGGHRDTTNLKKAIDDMEKEI